MTQKDIAKKCGVNFGAVKMVLKQKGDTGTIGRTEMWKEEKTNSKR